MGGPELRADVAEPEYRAADGWRIYPFDTASIEPTYLLENADGSRWELSAATARCLEELAAHQSLDVIAARLAVEFNHQLTEESLRDYVGGTLRRMGVVVDSANTATERQTRRSGPRVLTVRRTLLSSATVAPLTRLLSSLFDPKRFWWHATLVVALSTIAIWYAAFQQGNALTALLTPTTLALLLVSGFVHELGHGAACVRLGARHSALGAGLYLIFPVFYMELDDAWRLKRVERAMVDAGGLYLQLLFGLVIVGVSAVWEPLRPEATAVITVLGLGVLLNLNPLFRFDGYWLLSDLLGVPNLRERSLRSLGSAWRGLRGSRRGDVSGANHSTLPNWIAHSLVVYAVVSFAFFAYWTRGVANYLAEVPIDLMLGFEAASIRARMVLPDGNLVDVFAPFVPLLLPALTLLAAILAVAMLVESGGRGARRYARAIRHRSSNSCS